MSSYVSRAGDKLAEANRLFRVDFRDKIVLDIGSSTGGFTDYALQNGAKKVIAVEKGTDQLSPKLRQHPRIELHEKTDVLNFSISERGYQAISAGETCPSTSERTHKLLDDGSGEVSPDIILIDVSFISILPILTHARKNLTHQDTLIFAMLKPQFEAKPHELINGRVKNSKIRRQIIKDFELKLKPHFIIIKKHDNSLKGREEQNQERFYLLKTSTSNQN